jgi:hypothetical protein
VIVRPKIKNYLFAVAARPKENRPAENIVWPFLKNNYFYFVPYFVIIPSPYYTITPVMPSPYYTIIPLFRTSPNHDRIHSREYALQISDI